MVNLPIFQANVTNLPNTIHQIQTIWSSLLNPSLNNPLLQGSFLNGLKLVTGNNQISHGLGRPIQGWIITNQNGVSSFYQPDSSQANPNSFFTLNSSAAVKVNIYVF